MPEFDHCLYTQHETTVKRARISASRAFAVQKHADQQPPRPEVLQRGPRQAAYSALRLDWPHTVLQGFAEAQAQSPLDPMLSCVHHKAAALPMTHKAVPLASACINPTSSGPSPAQGLLQRGTALLCQSCPATGQYSFSLHYQLGWLRYG